ncbi:MAG: NFACT family protein, partial [Bacilli bacterium]|nr:NFACT family protein [Bacilli bacterium]
MIINYLELKEISKEINEKVKSNHIANIALINSSDIVFAFSYYRKEKLLISLNHNSPFIGMINKDITFPTVLNKLCEELRQKVKDTIVTNIEVLNNDRIIQITLQKTDEFFAKHVFFLILELIPHHPNLLILDASRRIIFANHYSSLTDKRIIIKGANYELPEAKDVKEMSVDLSQYDEFIQNYLDEALKVRMKEKYSKLIDTIKRKLKTANNKTKVLNKEIEEAKEKLIYQEYGTTLLTLKDDKEFIEQYIKENDVPFDQTKSYVDNANILFKKYKKSKETIAKDKEQIEINNALIEKLNHDICSLN